MTEIDDAEELNTQRIHTLDDSPITETKQKHIKVLVVDDSSYNLFVIEELLNSLERNIEITQAMNGEEAIEKITSLVES